MQFIQCCLVQIRQSKIGELLRYLLAGSIAFLVHLSMLAMLVEIFLVEETLASGIGFVFAAPVNYTLQKVYVFKSSVNTVTSFSIYCMVTTVTLILNVILFWILSSATNFHYFLVQIVTTVAIFILNYYLNRNITFMQR